MKVHRKRAFYEAVLLSAASILLLGSCAPGQRPFLQVQFCVANAQGVDLFKKTLQAIAREEHMRYIDGSETTSRDLKILRPAGKNTHTNGGLVYVGVDAGGFGLEGGNLGLNPYDISIGFGPDTAAARAFSKRVVARLKQHWSLKVVPKNSGAFPNPECSQGNGGAT
jgi:hypothetical protein